MQLLARREHTRAELERKLAPYAEDSAEVQSVLDDFSARGWLSESRAIEQIVHAKRSRFGTARIRQALMAKGVSNESMAPALENLKETEVEAARAVWARKFKTAPGTAADRARQVRFLQSRGFSLDIAMRVVRGAREEDED
ncbi:MAG TPA: recombination regulator RecX [Burkholderiales bacterium]|nr:recombination regulator RecX [Burkholderiales bacterium]